MISEAPQTAIAAKRCYYNGLGGRALRLEWANWRALRLDKARGRTLQLGLTWEVATWKIAHLGSCHLGKYLLEVAVWGND